MTERMAALGDLFQIGSSKRVLKSQWKAEGVPFYRGREITRLATSGFVDNELFISEEHFSELAAQSGVPKAGDIVITAIGTIGNSHVVRENDRFYFKDASVLWMKRASDVSSEFINLWLKSPLFFDQLEKGNGATVDTLTIQKLQSLRLSVPQLPEQRRIVAILDAAFADIATAKANAEKNLQNARALFESHLQSILTAQGEGWECLPLSDICDIKHGFAFDGADFSNVVPAGNPLVITPGNFTEEGKLLFNHKNSKRLNGKVPVAFRFNVGDLVVVMTDLSSKMKILGKPAFVDMEDILHNQRIGRLVFRSETVDKRFVYYFMMSDAFLKNIRATATGTMVRHTAPSRILSNVIPFPTDLVEQKKIVQKLDWLLLYKQRLESIYQQKLTALDELKKSLLHQAFSGAL